MADYANDAVLVTPEGPLKGSMSPERRAGPSRLLREYPRGRAMNELSCRTKFNFEVDDDHSD